MSSTIILLAILAAAILGKANSVAIATCALLMLKLLGIDKYVYPTIEKSGMTYGLILLIAAIMIPLANGHVTVQNIKSVFTSWIGITALVLSFLTTYLSGQGLNYLTVQGHGDIMPAMIIGAVAAASFLGGVPVGPLITSGILAIFAKMIHQ
ncbi:DUF441 domain-containing protein [Clostridium algoriphilum]|uniref:DUF441 domain-containing protein n=1 Tax=Clostridium algoriphilum TaxID=198347 RepID=UPI001CF3F79A|nr:DUF441 domain-containing protein [Clostridium algoriphilum]MCB2293883.1 DUF441 domain-containing protein [Clostridium algoriphilum]